MPTAEQEATGEQTERVAGAWLKRRVERNPDEPFVKCGGDWLSPRQLDEQSDRLAVGLAERGLTKGDRIAFLVPNRQEMVELFFACAKLGVILPLNYWLKGEFLRYQIADCQATMLVVDDDGIERRRRCWPKPRSSN